MKDTTYFATEAFAKDYHYTGALGAICSSEGTRIRLWAPTAETVFLHLYPTGNGGVAMETVAMERREKGVWSYRTTRDLHGVYYDFDVTVNGKTQRTADPYAKACGVNGARSMVVDLRKTDR